MNEPPRAPIVLIADDDIAFLWWLGELFHDLGYQSVPALSCSQALSLIRKSGRYPDLLVIDPRLKGCSRLIKTLSRTSPPKIVFIQGPDIYELSGAAPGANIERPVGWGPVLRSEWRLKLQRLLIEIGLRAAS